MVTIRIKDNQLAISGIDDVLRDKLCQTLSLPNPQYEIMCRLGKPVWYVKKYIEYFKIDAYGNFWCGRGVLGGLMKYLEGKGHSYEIIDERLDIPRAKKLASRFVPRDYQHIVFNDVIGKHEHGVLKLSVGFGKTGIALEIAHRLNQKTLIIVHREHLMNQFLEEVKKFFPGTSVGIIKGKKCELGNDVVIGMVQTLDRIRKKNNTLWEQIRVAFGLVAVDECHEYVTTQRLKVIQSFNSRYLFGFSGTPERTDLQDRAIFMSFGPIISEHTLPQKLPVVHVVNNKHKVPVLDYHDMIDEMIACEGRNKLIVEQIKKQVQIGRKVVVLVKRVKHIGILHEEYAKISKGRFIPIYSGQKGNDKLFASLREGSGKYDVICSTYSLIATGSDIPTLDTLIFAGDIRSSVLSKQSVGRILRLFEGKQDPLIIDICDISNGILYNQFKERCRMYKKLNWEYVVQ